MLVRNDGPWFVGFDSSSGTKGYSPLLVAVHAALCSFVDSSVWIPVRRITLCRAANCATPLRCRAMDVQLVAEICDAELWICNIFSWSVGACAISATEREVVYFFVLALTGGASTGYIVLRFIQNAVLLFLFCLIHRPAFYSERSLPHSLSSFSELLLNTSARKKQKRRAFSLLRY